MTDADHAETEALNLAEELRDVLASVHVSGDALADWMPERLSFLLARDNYEQCLEAMGRGHDITAGNLARALFEEAMRWSWVDEDQDGRRTAFLGAAAHRYRQVDEAGRKLGIEPDDYYGPLVAQLLRVSADAIRFPRQVEGQLEWGPKALSEMLYTQYRLFSQYTHSSLLATASVAHEVDGGLVVGRLPQVARMTVLRNAVANMAVIVEGCKAGLQYPRDPRSAPLNFRVMSYAAQVAGLLQPFAPATE
jgi:hypothetical protein